MDGFDRELRRLREDVARAAQLRARLKAMRPRREPLAEKERVLAELRAGAEEDVERLQRGSLARFFFSLTGSLEERLERETEEARAAAVKHDAVRRELRDLEADILASTSELDALRGCEQRYAEAVERKAEALKSAGAPCAPALEQLEQKLAAAALERRELEEAVRAGEEAESAACAALDCLESASTLGTLDVLGGGLMVNMAKFEQIDEAQDQLEKLGVALRRFSTELCELGEGLQLEIDSSTCFADIFLDNIFTDAMVRSLVWDAGQDVSGILDRIRERLGGLRPELERSRSVESGLNAEYERLVLGE